MTRTAATPAVPTPGPGQAWSLKALTVWPQPDGTEKDANDLEIPEVAEITFSGAASPASKSVNTGLQTRCSSEAEPVVESSVGGLLVPYEDIETCLFLLSPEATARARARDHFVTLRIGPVGCNGLLMREESIKVAGDWSSSCRLEWALRGLPLKQMAQKSPLGLVACRFKIWVKGYLSRYWLGRSSPAAIPCPPQVVLTPSRRRSAKLVVEIRRGTVAEAAVAAGVKVTDVLSLSDGAVNLPDLVVQALPRSFEKESLEDSPKQKSGAPLSMSYAEAVGSAAVHAVTAKHWGVGKALLEELQGAPESMRRKALRKADSTRKTVLRMSVDGLAKESNQLLQALEGGILRLILGKSRQYWWCFQVETVCCNSLWFEGSMCIGIPRSRGCGPMGPELGRRAPPWLGCIWSDPQVLGGQLELSDAELRFTVHDGHGTELRVRRVGVGEVAMLGHSRLRNPLGLPMLAARGTVAGKVASGVFDPAVCARFAAEMKTCGPRAVARLAMDLGADPRSLADDGLSPYTAAILREDPCGLLRGLDVNLRRRILRGDENAWAEVARSAAGKELPDIAAGALSRGLAIPQKMVEELLTYCFDADLPFLALRVLERVDGKRFLLPALERAHENAWQRVAERIVGQLKPDQKPYWMSPPAIKYAVQEIQRGRSQYRILLQSFLNYLGANEEKDFLADPCVLAARRGGAECPICLEPLCRSTPTAFVADRAICLHFLCINCARGYASSTNSQGDALRCPECRRHAVDMQPLPSMCQDPLTCFEFLSGEENYLARPMLLRTLSALLPLDSEALEAQGDALDPEVSAEDFISNPLFVWVWRHLQEHQRCMQRLRSAPNLEDRRAWFKYWNFSNTGRLTRSEVLRAILRSFRVTSLEKQKISDLRSRVEKVWDVWITRSTQSGRGVNPNSVNCEEFAMELGFGDLLDEFFASDPEGNDLHPAAKEAVPRLQAGLPRGRHPALGRLQHRLQPRPAASPTRTRASTPPPELEVPSEMLPPVGQASQVLPLREMPEVVAPAMTRALRTLTQHEELEMPPVGMYAWQSETESSESGSDTDPDSEVDTDSVSSDGPTEVVDETWRIPSPYLLAPGQDRTEERGQEPNGPRRDEQPHVSRLEEVAVVQPDSVVSL